MTVGTVQRYGTITASHHQRGGVIVRLQHPANPRSLLSGESMTSLPCPHEIVNVNQMGMRQRRLRRSMKVIVTIIVINQIVISIIWWLPMIVVRIVLPSGHKIIIVSNQSDPRVVVSVSRQKCSVRV